ncbi:hypothetical protein EVAR_66382_1 [Eumeta japonica]|uniref:Protein ALP1-like n=1 Tax=Eumeta variegata TaxID=151549 RepID=A0A4C1ZL36_EUMVA|nr:hypothetical protein EVAR_66382_1 [Eumeta japonica]
MSPLRNLYDVSTKIDRKPLHSYTCIGYEWTSAECNQVLNTIDMAIKRLTVRQLALIAMILDEEEEENQKTTRRYWIHDSVKERKTEGEFWTLYKHLVEDEEKFFQYFRMSTYQFNVLLKKIENDIFRRNTNFRECLSSKEKLAVCLR